MKHQIEEIVKVPTTVKVTCDVCGEQIQHKMFRYDDITVTRSYGVSYGHDGGDGKELIIDLCGKCFDSVLVPALKSASKLDTFPTYREYDF